MRVNPPHRVKGGRLKRRMVISSPDRTRALSKRSICACDLSMLLECSATQVLNTFSMRSFRVRRTMPRQV